MNGIHEKITGTIGNTPIVRLGKLLSNKDANVWAKLEFFNPGGSVKDRIAFAMIKDAEEKGLLKKGGTIIEPTSGNTGIGLALVAAKRGYKLILAMPEAMSKERRDLLKAYGAELVLVKPSDGLGMTGAIKKAEELAKKNNWFMPQQFKNEANPLAHEKTTGSELVNAFKGRGLDYFVAGVGTGGTITGAGRVLRKFFSDIEIFAVEPKESPVLSGGKAGKHAIQGIGAGVIPEVLDTDIYDDVIQVSNEDAMKTARRMAEEEGILAGPSAGAAVFAALKVAKGKAGKNLAVIIPDTGERYLSTSLFSR